MRSSTTTRGAARRGPRTTIRFATVAAAVAAVAVLGGCTDDSGWGTPPSTIPLVEATEVSPLRVVDDCEQLVEQARPTLLAAASSMWPEDVATTTMATDFDSAGGSAAGSAEDRAAVESSAPPSADGFAAPSSEAASAGGAESAQRLAADSDAPTGTNNQEVGVDESDLVKTDGARIVSVVNGVLRVTEIDDSPAVDGTLDLSIRSATELFLRGDTALVIGSTYGPGPMGRGAGFTSGGDVVVDGDMMLPRTSESSTAESSTAGSSAGAPPTTTGPTATVPSPDDTTTTVPDDAPTTTLAPTTTAPTTTAPATTVPSTTVPTTEPPTTEPVPIEPSPFAAGTTLTLVSLEDPAAPRVIQTAEVEGSLVSARQVGGTARIVLRSEPIAMYDMMTATDGASARAIAAELDSDALLPRIAVDGDVAPLGGCGDVLLTPAAVQPAAVSDPTMGATSQSASSWSSQPMPSTVTVLTVGETLDDVQPVSVQGSAETIYASTDALYVAANNWDQAGSRTDVHRFDLPAEGPATYSGSGRVPGRLLNQFSLSDHDGALRIVTTVDGPVGTPDGAATTLAPMPGGGETTTEMFLPSTSARLTVLDTEGDTLDEIGHLDGLGVGEEVQSVRFMGDTGYVVTFRQTDPLYALDLSDPRAPRALGELKIPGFSEYLHPIGDGLLLGIGRDADPTTGMDLGFKASLFDVSDPAAMVEVDQLIVPNAWSDVSSDHKAFTWDAERSQAIFPIDSGGPSGTGAIVLRVSGGQLTEVARIAHTTPMGQLAPMRSIVVDDDLWTLSYGALGRSDAASPDSVELVGF
ncbi:MAG: beta-propeller domain-containing protein [Actinomycetota bacterium]|nr:beta-propeller domain-containing protein [Actinomycetota bacterium]